MPAQTYEGLLRALKKGELASVYYLHGPEDILKDEAIRAILDRALDPSLRDFNLDQGSAAQLDPEAVHALCNTLPMMADRRVVLIRDVEAWKRKTRLRAEFLRYAERPAAETLVVLVQGAGDEAADRELAKHAVTVACEPLPPDRALKWLVWQAERAGVTFAPGGAEHLLACTGGELGLIYAELQKLASLDDPTGLGADRVGEIVGIRRGETVQDWRDAVLNDDAGRAVGLLAPVLDQPGVTGVRLVTTLGTALVGLGIARSHWDRKVRGRALEDAIFKTLLRTRPMGVGDWKHEAAAWARWAERWPARRIRGALRAALDADRALKSTTISDDRGVLADLVMRVTVGTRADAGGDDTTGRTDRTERMSTR